MGDPNDPLSLNLYTYCNNEPIRYFDPTGHYTTDQYMYYSLRGMSPAEQEKIDEIVNKISEPSIPLILKPNKELHSSQGIAAQKMIGHASNMPANSEERTPLINDTMDAYDLLSMYGDTTAKIDRLINGDPFHELATLLGHTDASKDARYLLSLYNDIDNIQAALLSNSMIESDPYLSKEIFDAWKYRDVHSSAFASKLMDRFMENKIHRSIVKDIQKQNDSRIAAELALIPIKMFPGLYERMVQENGNRDLVTNQPVSDTELLKSAATGVALFGVGPALKGGAALFKSLVRVVKVADEAAIMSKYSKLAGAGGDIISASGKAEDIVFNGANLSNRQAQLLEQLPEYGSRAIVPKKMYSTSDLAALTAQTGDEFAMFTTGGRRMIIRGNPRSVPINTSAAEQLSNQGWRWSAHSHPGISQTVLTASGGDKAVLSQFINQVKSRIFNSVGRSQPFGKDWSDWLPGQ